MPRYLTIGYGDQAGHDRTPQPLRDAAHAMDRRLLATGAQMGIGGAPVQVRNPQDGGLQVAQGPFLRADLPIAGFALIEAATLDDAIEMMRGVPCAVADGVVEIWPLTEPDQPR